MLPFAELVKFPATLGLAALAVGVTLASWSHPLLDVLAMRGDVLHDAPWTPFTTCLVHADVLHLWFNVYWLLALGVHVERENGSLATFLGYALAAVGSVLPEQALLNGGVGLSGVGYAVFAYGWARARTDPEWARVVDAGTTRAFVAWFFFCIVTTVAGFFPVANVAHGVGALLGALAGLARTDRRMLAALAAVWALAFVLDVQPVRDRVNLVGAPALEAEADGLAAIDRADSEAAVTSMRRAAALAPNDARVAFNLGVALSRSEEADEACAAFARSLELDPGADYARDAVAACAGR